MKNIKHQANGVIRNGVSFEEFSTVFKVYEGYPFYESWSEEEVKAEYLSFEQEGGCIFGYYIDDKCVAILTLHPMVQGEHPVYFPEGKRVMYLSDVATLGKFRGMGIATQLFHHALHHTEVLGYDYIYLRTNYDEAKSMSAGIAQKCGFKRIWDSCQEVEMRRIDGNVSKDLRMFMQKKIK